MEVMPAGIESTRAASLGNDGEGTARLVTLHDKLDELWEKYLTLLDEYQKAQKEVQKHMSAVSDSHDSGCDNLLTMDMIQGFFSITQANFKSATRGRYGSDYYDDRMKASRCYRYEQDGDDNASDHLQLLKLDEDEPAAAAKGASSEHEKEAAPQQQPSPPSTPAAHDSDTSPAEPVDLSAEEGEKSSTPQTGSSAPQRDPLHWFGILVPRELRSAQSTFFSAINGPILQATNAARALREVEAEIRRARKDVRRAEKAAGT